MRQDDARKPRFGLRRSLKRRKTEPIADYGFAKVKQQLHKSVAFSSTIIRKASPLADPTSLTA
jgi:hypothetical protein